jgi:uncharacterized protein (TIGR02391 family)
MRRLADLMRSVVPKTSEGGAAKRTFASVIPTESVLVVSLDEIALVVLRSLRNVRPSDIVTCDPTTTMWARSYPRETRARAKNRLIEAWQHLLNQGLIAPSKYMGVYETCFVTQKGLAAAESGRVSYGDADLLPRGLLVRPLEQVAAPLYYAGRYDDACAAAFRHLEVAVRELSALPDTRVGVELVKEAFKPNEGPLTVKSDPMAEQLAVRDLFVGAVGYYRNPLMHRHLNITDAAKAASMILLANELLATATGHRLLNDEAAAANTSRS